MRVHKKKNHKLAKIQAQYGLKKHISQMDGLERDFLMRRFYKIPKTDWKFTNYSLMRFTERGVCSRSFLSLWDGDADLIEYHCKDGENRILLRSRAITDEQVCAVFSLTTLEIVTVYLNSREYKHETLAIEHYNPMLDVIATFERSAAQ